MGHVASTGVLLNIKDAYHHPLFYRGFDQETGFKTRLDINWEEKFGFIEIFISRNILCFPICDNNEVIGVAELCNKQAGTHFTKFDQEMAMAFR